MDKPTTYVITRNCCTSGQCFDCLPLGYGRQKRVEQFRTTDKKYAEQVRSNWREYGAEIEEAK